MGTELHCTNISDFFQRRCATVSYAEYLPPSVIYQYEGEPVREIIGADDYKINQIQGEYCVSGYGFNPSCGEGNSFSFCSNHTPVTPVNRTYLSCQGQAFLDSRGYVWRRSGFAPDDGVGFIAHPSWQWTKQQDTECSLIVYKNGEIVHTEIRESCPIFVDVLPCQLDQTKNFDITVEPWEFLLLTSGGDGQLSTRITEFFSFIDNPFFNADEIENYIDGNPDECIMVWKFKLPFFPTLIGQYCSYPGCPPPDYFIRCKSCCSSCPPDTCAVLCGDTVCCYGADGVAVETIPVSNYCQE